MIDKAYNEKLVSVILPTYNRGYIIENTIKSVINQTYERWELIIVDDASTDNTEQIISKLTDDRITYLKNETNRGSNFSRNRGASIAKGQFLAFIDSDNIWLSEKLTSQVHLMEKEDGVGLVFCREKVDDGISSSYIPDEDVSDIGEILIRKNVIDTSTALIRRECFEAAGKFDERMPRLQDWDLFFRLVVVYGFKAVYMNQCLNINYIQPDSITTNNKKFTDAMAYFLQKHSQWYSSLGSIKKHVLLMLHETDTEEEYIYACKKILKLIIDNDKLMSEYIDRKAVPANKMEDKKNIEEKYKRWYRVLYSWKLKSDKNKESIIKKYFDERNHKKIAIYGLGNWGELIYQELKRDGLNVVFGIDEKKKVFHGIEIRKSEDDLNDADIIIVSVFMEFKMIKEKIMDGFRGEIVSILDIIEDYDSQENR